MKKMNTGMELTNIRKFKFGDVVTHHNENQECVFIRKIDKATVLLRNPNDYRIVVHRKYVRHKSNQEFAWKKEMLSAIKDRAVVNGHTEFEQLVELIKDLRELAILGYGPAPTAIIWDSNEGCK